MKDLGMKLKDASMKSSILDRDNAEYYKVVTKN